MTPLPHLWQADGIALLLLERPPGTCRATASRQALAGLLGMPAITVHRSPHGKPLLFDPVGTWCSFAHRAGLSLIGAGWDGPVGVDIEAVRNDLPLCDIADVHFSAREAHWLRGLPQTPCTLGFAALWAAKEALLKATGQGIAGGMQAPAFDPTDLAPLMNGDPSLCLRPDSASRIHLQHGTAGGQPFVTAIATLR